MRWLTFNRAAALAGASFWLASLALPVLATPIEEIDPGHPAFISKEPGWSLALFGWAGAFELNFAWFANPVLAWAFFRLLSVKPMTQAVSFFGVIVLAFALILAVMGLEPRHIDIGDDHGVNGLSYPLFGAYVWLASFAPILLAYTVGIWRQGASLSSAPQTETAE